MTDSAAKPSVLIYGAGAVGCFLGGMLAASSVPVTLLGRPALWDGISRNGLRIESPGGTRLAHVSTPVITALDQLRSRPDVVILTTKAYAVGSALPDLTWLARERNGSPVTVLAVQNGVGTEETLARSLAGTRIAAAAMTISLDMTEPGRVRLTRERGGLAIAGVAGHPRTERLAQLFESAGIVTSTHLDYSAMKWSKLLLNLMGNAISAVIGWTPARIYHDPELFAIEREAFLEALRVMGAGRIRSVPLPGFHVPILPWVMRAPSPISRWLIEARAGAGRGDKMPSLRMDALSGRGRSEIAWLNGAVVVAGERGAIATPVNRRLVRMVHGVTRSDALRRGFAERRDLLIQNVAIAPREPIRPTRRRAPLRHIVWPIL